MTLPRRSMPLFILLVSCGSGGGSGDPSTNPDIPVEECTPGCDGKQCGDDGCGGSCGECAGGAVCNPILGMCIGGCQPSCDGRECGDDGCGGSCGGCDSGVPCNTRTGKCDPSCQTDCGGKQCGDDGCGGSCGFCPEGSTCQDGQCKGGMSCVNGQQDGTESDVDCGGVCGACGIGKKCGGPTDCTSKTCQDGLCAAAASCEDLQKNGNETDTDCGGPDCPKCGVGKQCSNAGDCTSNECPQGVCKPQAACNDGTQNGAESDVDCGGGGCPGCALGKFCKGHPDCLSLNCYYGVCKEPSCDDGSKNQGETDTDCGGPKCDGCPDGKHCLGNGDCASASCEGGLCISCSDGLKNGAETDVDCGGGKCKKCPNGKHCLGPSDCDSKGCEGGQCCSPNACGQCTTTPKEICDGKDNDCDGKTDEQPDIGSGQKCPKQYGVCAGAWQACKGAAGWVCDDVVYKQFSQDYEPVETKCDGLDNDCDGQKDKGLLNACGLCGKTPAEVCNGADDDCNGKTDDLPACTACSSSGQPVQLYKVSSSWGFQINWTNFLAMLDDKAYVYYYPRGDYTKVHLAQCGDGKLLADWTPGLPSTGNNSITSGGGKLHFGTAGYYCSGNICTHHAQYYRYTSSGAKDGYADLGSCANISGQPAVVSYAQGKAWVAFWDTSSNPVIYEQNGDKFDYLASASNTKGDYGLQFVVDEAGIAHVAWNTSPWNDKNIVHYLKVGTGQGITLCSQNMCGRPSLQKAPDGSLHVVYTEKGTIRHRTGSGSDWSAAEDVDTGEFPNIGFTPGSLPVVSYTRNKNELWVSPRKGASWKAEKVWTASDSKMTLSSTAVGVDSAGRYHIAFEAGTSDYYAIDDFIFYVMHCPSGGGTCTPDCGGKKCGPDGCGGLCGQCNQGEECVDGQCKGQEGCGTNPAKTCKGKCGGAGIGGCYCDSECSKYFDCCPDKAACCP